MVLAGSVCNRLFTWFHGSTEDAFPQHLACGCRAFGDLERLMASARSNQTEVERVADELNRISLELSKMDKRVAGNEEWVASINAFRRQINAAVADLNASVRAMQAAP